MTNEISGGITPLKKTTKDTYCFAPNCRSASKSVRKRPKLPCFRCQKTLSFLGNGNWPFIERTSHCTCHELCASAAIKKISFSAISPM